MRIQRIELQNFRSYEQRTITLDEPRTLLIGENGTGKSTLIDAVAWCLTGRCRGVDGRGAGQKDLIRVGADQATVSVVLDGWKVTRTVGKTGSATATVKTDTILAKLGATEAMLLATLYGRHFFSLHHGEAKAMLMQLLNVTIPLDQLPPDLAKNYSGPLTLDEAQAAYDAAFKDRAATKKALAAVLVPDVAARPDLDGQNPAAFQQAIQEARKAYQAAVQTKTTATAAVQTKQIQLDEARLAASSVDQLKGKVTAHQDMLAQADADLAAAKTALGIVQAKPAEPVATLKAEAARLITMVQGVEGHSKAGADGERACILSHGIPCLTAAAAFKGEVKRLKADVKALEARITAGMAQEAELAAAQQAVRTQERQVSYHQEQLQRLNSQLDAALAQAQTIEKVEGELAHWQQRQQEADAPVRDAQAKLDQLVQQQTDLAGYVAQLKGRDRAVAERAKLEGQLEQAEALVSLLGPKGLPPKLLGQAVVDFEGMINAALQGFGFTLSIQADPWGVFVRTPDVGQPIPFDLLSAGEQLWTGLAFQLALAAISGLDFCCLDAAESVVGQRRAILTQLVMGAPLAQVIVAMAKGSQEAAPEIPGLQVVRMVAAAAV